MKSLLASGGTRNAPVFILWCVLIVPIMVLISVPTSVSGQAFLGIVAVATVALLKPFARHLVPRFVLLATGA